MNKEKLIRKYSEEGLKKRQIAKKLGISRYQVDKALIGLNSQKVDAFEMLRSHRVQIHEWLTNNHLPAKIIHERLIGKGVKVSYPTLCRFLKTFLKKEVYVPIIVDPGMEAQVDYGYMGQFDKGNKKVKVWAFNMVLSYSRYAFYTLVTDQTTNSFLQCHVEAFEFFRGVPASVKIDNLGAGVLEADFFEPTFQQKYADFLEHYDTTAITCRIARGQDKGKVESGIKYLKNNFLPSVNHTDFHKVEDELRKWLKTQCNVRTHGTTQKIPLEEYNLIEKAKLQQLPAERYQAIEHESRKVNQYGHVYFKHNYYSVPAYCSGSVVQLESNGSLLKIYVENTLLATHPVCKEQGKFITEEKHKPYYKQTQNELYFKEQAESIGESAVRLLKLMQAEKPFHWRAMMKGILNLSKVYPSHLIEKACLRTIICGPHTYKKVRLNCEKLIDEPEESRAPLTNVNGYFHELSVYDELVIKLNNKSK